MSPPQRSSSSKAPPWGRSLIGRRGKRKTEGRNSSPRKTGGKAKTKTKTKRKAKKTIRKRKKPKKKGGQRRKKRSRGKASDERAAFRSLTRFWYGSLLDEQCLNERSQFKTQVTDRYSEACYEGWAGQCCTSAYWLKEMIWNSIEDDACPEGCFDLPCPAGQTKDENSVCVPDQVVCGYGKTLNKEETKCVPVCEQGSFLGGDGTCVSGLEKDEWVERGRDV